MENEEKEADLDKGDVEVSKNAEERAENEPKDGGKEREERKDVDNATKREEDKNAEFAEEVEKGKGSKKRAGKKSEGKKSGTKKKEAAEEGKGKEPKTPATTDRPVRERKSVERLVAVIDPDASGEVRIEKGRGTALRDIPNVAYKLSKRKPGDDTIRLLYTVLFGKRGKATHMKSNILRFSGFVWRENEEKQKRKVKEKLDKSNEEKLMELCDLLDVPIDEAAAKKEDVIVKLIEFLLAPHATTSESAAEKDQSSKGKKRPRASKKSGSTSEATPSKRLSKKHKNASKEDNKKGTSETGDSEESEDEKGRNMSEESDDVEEISEDTGSEENVLKEGSKKRKRGSKKEPEPAVKTKPKKPATPKTPTKKTPAKPSTSQPKPDDESGSAPKTFSRKKKKDDVVDEKLSTPKKPVSKEKTGKKGAKDEKKGRTRTQGPSDDELEASVSEILKVVDFNTATFTDILKQLGTRFGMDLTPRKAAVKIMIQDELTKLADEADDDDDDEEEDDAQKPAGKGVDEAQKLAGKGVDEPQKPAGKGVDEAQKAAGKGVDEAQKPGKGVDKAQKTEKGVDKAQKTGKGTDKAQKPAGKGVDEAQKPAGKGVDKPQKPEKGVDEAQEPGKHVDKAQKPAGKGVDEAQKPGKGVEASETRKRSG